MFKVRGRTGANKGSVSNIISYYMANKSGTAFAGILENATYPDGTPIPLVAFWNEFGTRSKGGDGKSFHTPPRPFLRMTARQHRKDWNVKFLQGLRRRKPSEEVLKAIGALMAGQIRKTISTFTDPPNAPATIRAKGKDSPLRDTGTLLNAISWEYEANVRSGRNKSKRIRV